MTTPHASWAKYYDKTYQNSFGIFYDELTEVTLECVKGIQCSPARILDFGAGTGRLAVPLAKVGYTVVAMDPCAEMLAVLNSKASGENLAIETVCCRMQDKDALSHFQSFDLALCVFTVLLYLLDEDSLKSSMQSAAHALGPGGHLLIDIPYKQIFQSYSREQSDFVRDVTITPIGDSIYEYDEKTRLLVDGAWVDYADRFQIRFWEKSQIIAALSGAGFVIEKNMSKHFAGAGAEYLLACLNVRGGMKLLFFGRFETHLFFGGFSSTFH